ncbi:MAG: nucleoside-diphosphate sugar epimerase/dehydratase [Vicinamibacterales bacterium]
MTDWLTRTVDRLYGFRQGILMAVHVALIVLSNQAAFWLRFDGQVPSIQQPYNTSLLPLLLVVRLAVFFALRIHQSVWRYASIWDLVNIIAGVTLSSVLFWAITHSVLEITVYPRSVFIIDAILLICLMGGARLARRLYHRSRPRADAKRVLIYGAGNAGELIVRDMRQNAKFHGTPVGFVDDDRRKAGQRIHGVPVLGGRDRLPEILSTYAPDELLIALPSASRDTLRTIVRTLEPFKIRITTLPRLHHLIGARIEVGQIRQLQVEDLLGRDPVSLDYGPVRQFLEGKRILVTGAGGSIGSELCRQIAAARPATLVPLDRYENSLFHIHNELALAFDGLDLHPMVADVTDVPRIDQVLGEARPQVVFHAAAHKHVPLMEDNPCEAVKNNVRGTRVMAEGALRHGVERFVLISTDKAVNPTNVMGATKRVAELIVHGLNGSQTTRFAAVRFGNVLASNGSVVPTFLAQIANGGPVTVTHPEMRRFFMLIPEAVQLVLHAAALGDRAPLYVLEMGEQVKVVDMARDLIRLSGYVPDKDILIEFTGMRHGEKLFEELVGDGEFTEPSSVEKVLRVQMSAPHNHIGVAAAVARLEALAIDGRNDQVLGELRTLVSHFTPTVAESSPT